MKICVYMPVYKTMRVNMCTCLCVDLHLSGYIYFRFNLTKKLHHKPSRGGCR